MTLDPFFSTTPLIQTHMLAGAFALVLGPVVLFRRRRDRLHKLMGYAWLISMIVLAVSAVFIPSRFPIIAWFGPIHLLCGYALWGVYDGVRAARAGDMIAHRATMRALFFGAAGLAGSFTLIPDRLIHQILFGTLEGGVAWLPFMAALGVTGLVWRNTKRDVGKRGKFLRLS